MPKKPLKTQQDLEKHLRVYINVLEDKGYDVDACVLKEAIVILHKHYYAVLPNQNRFKRTALEFLCSRDSPASSDDIMDALMRARLISDRRRVSSRLAEWKRKGIVTNPIRGYWIITKTGRKYIADKFGE